MAVDITFLGHAGFILGSGQHQLVIDPFLSGNPKAKQKPEDITCTHLALTHGHADHYGDTITILKNNSAATVYAAYEICNHVSASGHEKCEPGNPGGKIDADFGWIAFTHAFHSSSYDGEYMGMPCGLVINIGGATLWHLGDTGIYSDMALFGEIYKPDVIMIPVGDRFTMGPELATRAAEMIKPKVAIPIHYATFPLIREDISGFKPAGIEVKALKPAETWSYNA